MASDHTREVTGHDKFIEGGFFFRVTIVVCSNDIPRAGIMDANHKYCDGYK